MHVESSRYPEIREFMLGICLAIYPACKIQKLAEYAFSEDQDELTDYEDKATLKAISVMTGGLAALPIAYFAQRILGTLRRFKFSKGTRSTLVAILFTATIVHNTHHFIKERDNNNRINHPHTSITRGLAALVTFTAMKILTKKIL